MRYFLEFLCGFAGGCTSITLLAVVAVKAGPRLMASMIRSSSPARGRR